MLEGTAMSDLSFWKLTPDPSEIGYKRTGYFPAHEFITEPGVVLRDPSALEKLLGAAVSIHRHTAVPIPNASLISAVVKGQIEESKQNIRDVAEYYRGLTFTELGLIYRRMRIQPILREPLPNDEILHDRYLRSRAAFLLVCDAKLHKIESGPHPYANDYIENAKYNVLYNACGLADDFIHLCGRWAETAPVIDEERLYAITDELLAYLGSSATIRALPALDHMFNISTCFEKSEQEIAVGAVPLRKIRIKDRTLPVVREMGSVSSFCKQPDFRDEFFVDPAAVEKFFGPPCEPGDVDLKPFIISPGLFDSSSESRTVIAARLSALRGAIKDCHEFAIKLLSLLPHAPNDGGYCSVVILFELLAEESVQKGTILRKDNGHTLWYQALRDQPAPLFFEETLGPGFAQRWNKKERLTDIFTDYCARGAEALAYKKPPNNPRNRFKQRGR